MILVVAEQKAGKLNRATWETIAAAQELSGSCVDPVITIVVLGSKVDAVAADLAAARVQKSSPLTIRRSRPTRPTDTRRRSSS